MPERYYRKIIRITGECSPNVRLAQEQIRAGLQPTGQIVVPGVLPWADYKKRRETWDGVQQCIGLDANFWKGADILLYPPQWLNRAERYAAEIRTRRVREAKGIGVDPAEGGDKTAMTAVDEHGIIEQISKKTPDTSVIRGDIVAFLRKHNCRPENVALDRGGGGYQIADELRAMRGPGHPINGYPVRTIAFGESVNLTPKRGMRTIDEKIEHQEERYVYFNRRAQMYHEVRLMIDPTRTDERGNAVFFGIPAEYTELRHQMALIPVLYDSEGRIRMLPKTRRSEESTERTLIDLIGHSPDELDSLVLAVHAMLHKSTRRKAGAIG